MSTQIDATTMKLRHDWVLLRVFNDTQKKIGGLVLPTGNDEYAAADVIAVGDSDQVKDLKVGDRVWVKHQKKHIRPKTGNSFDVTFTPEGIRLTQQDDQPGDLILFDEFNVISKLPTTTETEGD